MNILAYKKEINFRMVKENERIKLQKGREKCKSEV